MVVFTEMHTLSIHLIPARPFLSDSAADADAAGLLEGMPRLVSFSHTGGFGPGDKVSITFEVGVSSSSSATNGRAKKTIQKVVGILI